MRTGGLLYIDCVNAYMSFSSFLPFYFAVYNNRPAGTGIAGSSALASVATMSPSDRPESTGKWLFLSCFQDAFFH